MSKHNKEMTYNLPVLKSHYCFLENGDMDFFIQFDDRNFRVGDILILQETSFNETRKLGKTGAFVTRRIKHITRKFKGLQTGYIVLGLEN